MIKRFVKDNQSMLLVVGASVGVLSTAYLTGRAAFKTALVLENEDPSMDLKEKVKVVWTLYIPAGASAAVTILCVAGVRHVDGRKTLAAQTALAVSQRAYESYRASVVEELGEKKDQLFVSKAVEKQVEANPPSTTLVVGSGKVTCYEAFSGRYFESDMQALNKAVNEINAQMLKQDYATLDDFYYLIELEPTMGSGHAGWSSDKLLELEYSSLLYKGNPVLAFNYNYVKSL